MLFWILFILCVAGIGTATFAFLRFQAQRLAERLEEEKAFRRAAEHRRRDLDETCAQVLASLSDSRRAG